MSQLQAEIPGPKRGPVALDDGRQQAWTELLELPGVAFACKNVKAESGVPMLVVAQGAPLYETAPAWAQLQMALASRTAAALDLGAPRVIVTLHDEHLLVLGMAAYTQVALILEDTASAGMAMVKVRRWLDAQGTAQ